MGGLQGKGEILGRIETDLVRGGALGPGRLYNH